MLEQAATAFLLDGSPIRAPCLDRQPPRESSSVVVADSRIVHSGELEVMDTKQGEFFAVKCRRLGDAAGNVALGCNLFELAPGKTAMPFHMHYGIEEAMYVLAGAGTLRLGSKRHAVKAGDYVAFLAEGDAHQLTNTGNDPLKYLLFSTVSAADVVVYPDSKKVGVIAGNESMRAHFFEESTAVGYWHGEQTGAPESKSKSESKSESKPEADDDGDWDDEEAELESRIDDEIAALKSKLGISGAKTRAKARSKASPKPPGEKKKANTATRKIVDSALDEIERLKNLLDGD